MGFSLKRLLEEPDFIKRADEFANKTTWDLYSKYSEAGLRVTAENSTKWSDIYNESWLRRVNNLADENGMVYLKDLPYGQSDDPDINETLGWNINDTIKRIHENEIYAAHSCNASAQIGFETAGTTNINDYNWNGAKDAVQEIARYAVYYGGRLHSKLSAAVYSRFDGTKCIQIFFHFTFSDDQETQSYDEIVRGMNAIIELVRTKGNVSGYNDFEINLES